MTRHRLGDRENPRNGQHKSAQQQPPNQMGRCRTVLDERARDQRSGRQTTAGNKAVHHRCTGAALRLQVNQSRAQRASGRSHCAPLQDSRPVEPPHTVGGEEQRHRPNFEPQRCHDHRPPAHIVRQRAHHQQSDDQGQRVDAEDRSQCGSGEPPLLLIDAVQRRGSARSEDQQAKHDRHQPKARAP